MKTTWKLALGAAALAVLLGGCARMQAEQPDAADGPVLTIGVDGEYEPYSYLNDTGELVGADIELAQEACRRIGRTPAYQSIQWDKKDEYLADGTIDCVWSCFTYTGREEQYLWAGPYLYSRQIAVVRAGSEVKDLADLAGKRVAVMSSTKPEELLLTADGVTVPQADEVLSYGTLDLAFTAMRRGYVDAAAGHETAVCPLIGTMEADYRVLETPLMAVQIGVAFRKGGDAALAAQLTDTLAEMAADGTTAEIVERYGLDAANVIGRESRG